MKISKLSTNNILNPDYKCFAKSGRDCFDFIYKNYLNKHQKILMPSYIGQTKKEGSGVFDPVRKNKLLFEFYQLDKSLQVDFSDLEKKIRKGKFQALLVIHYFGFFQLEMKKISSLCQKYKVVLIEDFCHTLFTPEKENYFSNFKIFSIHKILNTQNGGYFISSELEKLNYKTIIEASFIDLESLTVFINTNLFEVKKKRISNYNYYCSELKNLNAISIMKNNLTPEEVPLNFPILVKNNLREKLYFFLISAGIETCAMWYEIIPEINKNKFPLSYNISNSILNLSTHHDIGKKEILYIVSKIKEFFFDVYNKP